MIIFPPLISYRTENDLATQTLDLCDTGFHPITVAKTRTRPAVANGTKTPFNN